MFKRMIAVMTILAAVLCLGVKADAADTRHTKDDTWLVYWYLCGADLESNSHSATLQIAEMQQVKLPPNIKFLICAGGTTQWYHPTLSEGGDGVYLYSGNRLEKQADWNEEAGKTNMGDPETLKGFLEYGEENFTADHKIIIFSDHGGLNGICYDENFEGDGYFPNDGLTYDELKSTLIDVYGDSPEDKPLELVVFDACITGSYELANTVSDFSHYMLGSEPSVWGWPFKVWIAALARDPSMNGGQIGELICNSAIKNYTSDMRLTHTFSVIDLTKMPELREAYEKYFDEALNRSNEEEGFSGAFARAAEARTADKYSNYYTDLGLLAKNTKSIMPDTSKKLLKAIDKAVVYKKSGAYLKSKGISTYYPYISTENTPREAVNSAKEGFEIEVFNHDSNYKAQKEFYQKLFDLKDLPESEDLQLEENSTGHFVATLTPEQLKNISVARCVLVPVKIYETSDYDLDLGGAVLYSADDLKID